MATATVEDAGPCKKLLQVVVPAAEVSEKVNESYEKLRESVNVDGFRKGHAPRRLLERRFGEKVLEEVKETLMMEASQAALDEHGFTAIGEPSFDNVEYSEGADLTFQVTVEIRPEFDLPDYKGLRLVRAKAVVTDEDVAEGLDRLRRRRATPAPAPRDAGAEDGDSLTVNWTASVEGEEVATDRGVDISVGAGGFGSMIAPGMGEVLRGVKAGETRELDVAFPDVYPVERCRGKDGKASVSVVTVMRPVLPELNDEFAAGLDFESLDELKETLRAQTLSRREREADGDLGRQATEMLLGQVEIELPEGLIKRQAQNSLVRRRLQLQYQGVPEDEIEEELAQQQGASEETAERDFKVFFLFERIAEKEKLFVTENEVENRIALLANSYRLSPQQMRRHLDERGSVSQLRVQMREERVMEFIVSNADIQDASE